MIRKNIVQKKKSQIQDIYTKSISSEYQSNNKIQQFKYKKEQKQNRLSYVNVNEQNNHDLDYKLRYKKYDSNNKNDDQMKFAYHYKYEIHNNNDDDKNLNKYNLIKQGMGERIDIKQMDEIKNIVKVEEQLIYQRRESFKKQKQEDSLYKGSKLRRNYDNYMGKNKDKQNNLIIHQFQQSIRNNRRDKQFQYPNELFQDKNYHTKQKDIQTEQKRSHKNNLKQRRTKSVFVIQQPLEPLFKSRTNYLHNSIKRYSINQGELNNDNCERIQLIKDKEKLFEQSRNMNRSRLVKLDNDEQLRQEQKNKMSRSRYSIENKLNLISQFNERINKKMNSIISNFQKYKLQMIQ